MIAGRSDEHPKRPPRESDGIPAWAYVLAIAGLLALLAIVLLAMGRVPWCECGYVKLWHGIVKSSENSQHLTDWYTPSHIVHGFGLYGLLWLVGRSWPLGVRLTLATAVEVFWEIIENTDFVINRYREATIALDYYGDSVINSQPTSWRAFSGSCWPLACRSGRRSLSRSASKSCVGYVIRDNLTLNIIMLIYPIEAIKEWQLGA